MELKMKAICEGRKTKSEVVHETIEQYREVYLLSQRRMNALTTVRTPAHPQGIDR